MVLKFRIGICFFAQASSRDLLCTLQFIVHITIYCAHYNLLCTLQFIVHITIPECSAGTSNIFVQFKVSSLEDSCFEM
jgi:hypothetical protein